jgi:hypothetical protein
VGHNFLGTEQLLLGVMDKDMELGESFKELKLQKKLKRLNYIGRGTGFVASNSFYSTSKESVRNGSPRR